MHSVFSHVPIQIDCGSPITGLSIPLPPATLPFFFLSFLPASCHQPSSSLFTNTCSCTQTHSQAEEEGLLIYNWPVYYTGAPYNALNLAHQHGRSLASKGMMPGSQSLAFFSNSSTPVPATASLLLPAVPRLERVCPGFWCIRHKVLALILPINHFAK